MAATVTQLRHELLDFLRRDLIGPAHGDREVLDDPPKIRYVAGVLFPQGSLRNESSANAGVEDDTDASATGPPEVITVDSDSGASTSPEHAREGSDGEHDDLITLANSYRPSAVGLTFMVDTTAPLTIQVRATEYDTSQTTASESTRTRTIWTRRPLEIGPVSVDLNGDSLDLVVAQGLSLRVVPRRRDGDRFLVTVSLYNTTRSHQGDAKTFFQTGLSVECEDGGDAFVEYRSRGDEVPGDDEAIGLAMLYRNRRVFAVGHGCAGDWTSATSDRTTGVATQDLPAVTVPPIIPLAEDQTYFNMAFLGGDCERPERDIPNALRTFCVRYEDWINGLAAVADTLSPQFRRAAAQNIEWCRLSAGRMRAGVDLIEADSRVLEAFTLLNRAMLMQQHHSRLRRRVADDWDPLPSDDEYRSDWSSNVGYWRAFQLAYILTTIPSVTQHAQEITLPGGESISEHDLVDLIWFPTGGGKTEAYLGLTAFVVFMSRFRDPSEGGCKVLMRYTLRLLTSQQFQRAASLVCACEKIRRTDPRRFGSIPITIGLWVGQSLTPNDEKDALKKLGHLDRKKSDAKNPFQLLSCPWCGTELNNADHLGYAEFRGRQVYVCPDGRCDFGRLGTHLPVCVVDETLYEQPATLIIGTVDKFAMLAWRERAGRLLKIGGGPELIIQDELHLISGPLGSMVGLYESVIDYLASAAGRRPKIIASTATIRRADAQCRALYNRPMAQFPPSGVDISDSFFAREDPSAPGRLYAGLLPSAASSPLTAQVRSVVALLQGLTLIAGPETPDRLLDPYWTLIQYFGSLKELGRAATFITADIPEFLPTMQRRYSIEGATRRYLRTAEELTSRRDEDEIPKILKRLETNYRRGAEWDDQALDTVLATNMISVGVDVDRLGLMMVVAQPKGTSEYIQASSRVGRSAKAPGLVLTLHYAGRPRDRSHYEHFRAYHEAFYRFVEPTSVTPFSPPAMERALHAVLAIAGRHIAEWKRPSEFDASDSAFSAFLDFLRERVRRVDEEHLGEFDASLRRLLDDWDARRPERWGDLSRSSEERVLLWPAGMPTPSDYEDAWLTPTSLRNVDVECGGEVIPRYSSAERPNG